MADIELVIKIPEEIRLALINNIQLSIDKQSICDSYIKHAIINGTQLSNKEDTLNKIKAEIEQNAFKSIGDSSRYIFVNWVNRIIDKYKSESEE